MTRSVAARELHAFPTPVVHALWLVAHVRTLADDKHRTRPVQNADTEPCLLARKTSKEYPAVTIGFPDLAAALEDAWLGQYTNVELAAARVSA
jgi:hypothetical protein